MSKTPTRTAARAADVGRSETVEVVATEAGFYGDGRIRRGATFHVPEGYTGSWFERTDGKPLGRKARRRSAEPIDGGVMITAEEYAEFERLKANPRENDNLDAAGKKIGEKADAVEDAAQA